MFAKIVVLILCLGACASGLLVARHRSVQAAHELAAARLRIIESDAKLAELRAEIAARVTPQQVSGMAESIGETSPISHQQPPDPDERDEGGDQHPTRRTALGPNTPDADAPGAQ